MSSLVDRLLQAQTKAISARPKVGGFPVMAELLREAGIQTNRWCLPSCQSVYEFREGSVVQKGPSLIEGTTEVPKFNQEKLIAALRIDQAGESSFAEFLQAAWQAGVVAYDVDFNERKVSYFGARGESYVERYPAVSTGK